MTASQKTARPRGRPLRDMPIEPEVMRRRPKPAPEPVQPKPEKAHKKRSPALTVLTVLLLLAIAAIAFWLVAGLFGGMLTLRTVTVEWPDGASALVSDAAVTEAAAITPGTGIYSLRTDAIEEAVLRENPYLASVEVERRLPDAVAIVCTPREAGYYLALDGEYFAISTDLVVLEQAAQESTFTERGLVPIILPAVKSALVGQALEFAGTADVSYLPALLAAHRASGLWCDTDILRIESRFDIRLVVRGNYALTLGNDSDAALKLSLAEKILADSLFASGTGAFLDLTNPAESSAILDKATDYSLLWRD